MHFGLFSLMTQRDPDKPARQIYAETVEQVRLAEQIGFEIAWFAEHHFSNYCLCPTPLAMVYFMAGQTKRIRLGPAVIVAPLYEPVRLLEDIAVADTLSDGRLVLGFGTGYQEYEFHKFGVNLADSRAITLEVLDAVERFLAGGPFGHAGKHVQIPETYCRVRPMQARPDIYVAGLANDPATQRMSAERGYVPFFTTGWQTLDEIAGTRAKVAAAYAETGRNPTQMPYAFQQYVFVTDDRQEALQAAEGARYIRRIATSMRQRYGEVDGGFLKEIPAPDEPPLEEIAERMVIGDPERCAQKLIKEIERLGPTHISAFMAIPGIPQKRVLRSMERFGSFVLPRLEKHFGKPMRATGTPPEDARQAARAARAS
ncbi:MAG: LLM class flavin-dependent oxidoreductase [Alphaproteobacteria bacterium]|nr:LLM class flavin-dependent oxidoreductase [Alphaproteobacteria bacterium]